MRDLNELKYARMRDLYGLRYAKILLVRTENTKKRKKNLPRDNIFYSIFAVCDIHRVQFKQHEPTKIHSNTSYGERVAGTVYHYMQL